MKGRSDRVTRRVSDAGSVSESFVPISGGKQNVNGNKCTDDTDCATLPDPYTAPAGFLSRAMGETANFFRSVVVGSTSFVQNAKTEFGSRSGAPLWNLVVIACQSVCVALDTSHCMCVSLCEQDSDSTTLIVRQRV